MPGTIGYKPATPGSNAAVDVSWRHEAFLAASGKTYTAGAGESVTEVGIYGANSGVCTIGIYTVVAGTITSLVASTPVTVGTGPGYFTQAVNWSLTNGVVYTVACDYWGSGQSGGETAWNAYYDAIGSAQLSSSTLFDAPLGATWSQNSTGNDAVAFYATVTGASVTTEQEGFRFHDDTGSESGAGWLAAQDTGITSPLGTIVRPRILIDTTGDLGSSQFRLEYKEDSEAAGLWRAIGVGLSGATPTVRAYSTPNNGTDALPAFTVNQPAGVATGDLLIAVAAGDTVTTAWTASPANNWTRLSNEVSGTACQLAVYAKVANGTDALSISATNNNDYSVAMVAIQVGTHGVTNVATDIVIPAAATNTTGNADPPTSGTVASKNWLAMAACAVDLTATGSTVSAVPSGYNATNVLTKSASSTSSVGLGFGHRALTAATSEDPGTFTNTSGAWVAKTLLIPPATAAPAIDVATSTQFANGDATTAQLTPPAAGSFTAGVMVEGAALANAVDIASGNYTEIEWAVKPQSPAVNTDAYQFRATINGTPLDTYSVTPTLTIGAAAPSVVGAPTIVSARTAIANVGAQADVAPHATIVTARTAIGNVGGAQQVNPAPTIVTARTAVANIGAQADIAPHATIVAARTAVGNVTSYTVLYPASISGRKVLDQNGDPYFIRTFSSWKMANKLTNAQITTALEGVAGNGFNGVTVWCGGIEDRASEGDQYTNAAGQNFWTGTPWQSSLGAAWASVDWIVEECARLGLVLHFSFCAGFSTEGAGPDWEAATNTQMHDAGVAIATRYAASPNIVWHVMFDDTTGPTSTRGVRIRNLFDGINDTEGASTRPVRWCEVNQGSTTDEQGWFGTALETGFTINGFYEYTSDAAAVVEAAYAASATLGAGSTPVPTMDVEPPYDGAGHYTGDQGQQLRERSYTDAIEGGVGINYGQEDWWPFTGAGIFSEGLDWTDVQAHSHTVQQSYVWALVDAYVQDATWAPATVIDNGATGEGTGDTKAAQGASSTAALVYFPTSRTVTVDTTIIGGTDPVRLRWYDPTAGTYSTIAAIEAQQTGRSVTLPAARGDGTRDFVLVIDTPEAVTPTGTIVTVRTAVASLTAQADIAPHATIVTARTAVGNVTGQATVTPHATIVDLRAAVATLGAQADIAPSATVVTARTAVANISTTLDVNPTPTVVVAITAVANVGGQATVAPSSTIVSARTAVANVTGQATVTPHATIVTARTAVANVGGFGAVEGLTAVVAARTAVANITAQASVAPHATIVTAVSAVADVARITVVNPAATVVTARTGVADVTGQLDVSGHPTVAAAYSAVAELAGQADVSALTAIVVVVVGAVINHRIAVADSVITADRATTTITYSGASSTITPRRP